MDLREERFRLNKDIPIPLYYQVKRMILNELASGNLKLGDKLPAETEFCEYLQLSRPTVRLALNELVAEGILIRKKRSGTFVAEPKIELGLNICIEQFQKYMEQTGRDCTVQVLDFCLVDKIGEINQRLNLSAGERLIYLKRKWMVGNCSIVYNATYMPESLWESVKDQDFTKFSLIDVLNRCTKSPVSSGKVKVEAVLASKNDIELLEIDRTRSSLLYIADLVQSEDGTPLCWSISRYRGDKVYLAYQV